MPGRQSRFTFFAKVIAALLLIAAADWLTEDFKIGSWLGGLTLGWTFLLNILRPAVRRGPAVVRHSSR